MLQNLSGWHALLILAIVLLVFGSSKLPALAKGLGQSVRILKDEIHDDSQPPTPVTPVRTTGTRTDVPLADVPVTDVPVTDVPVADVPVAAPVAVAADARAA